MYDVNQSSKLLRESGLRYSASRVIEMANNGQFPNAVKNNKKEWRIPEQDLVRLIKKQKRINITKWITISSVTTFITILSIISITKDGLDLITQYIIPNTTATIAPVINPTAIPAPILSYPAAMSCLNSGHALEVMDTDGTRIRCEYESRGLLYRVIDSSGNSIQYSYDSHGRLIEYIDSQGHRFRFNLPPPE